MSAVRYTSAVVASARLHRQAGWLYSQIPELLERELGVRPSQRAVWAWCNQEKEAIHQAIARPRNRANQRARRGIRPQRAVSPDLALERMRLLRADGVSLRAIGVVAGHWWGEALSESQVRYRLGGGA